MMSEVEGLDTPLTRQMAAFGKTLSFAIIGMAVLMFFIGWLRYGFDIDELFSAAIGFAVAAIPEGLPAVMTITLARQGCIEWSNAMQSRASSQP